MFVRTNVLNAIIFYLGENNDENDATFISAEIVLGFNLIKLLFYKINKFYRIFFNKCSNWRTTNFFTKNKTINK